MRWIIGALLAFGLVAATGCGRQIANFGYAGDKVWYHVVEGRNEHYVVACDVLGDGRETNCRKTRI